MDNDDYSESLKLYDLLKELNLQENFPTGSALDIIKYLQILNSKHTIQDLWSALKNENS
jgi:hypothetical protein